MSAAVLAEGRTVIRNAAREPEVQELAHLLNEMGAQISGIGTSTLVIEGVPVLHGAKHEVIPDRIEAGTFMIAAAITGGDVLLERVRWEHVTATVEKLRSVGVAVEQELFGCRVKSGGSLSATEVITAPYPGFPTDAQAPFTALMSLAAGQSRITDAIFPDRFTHVDELNRLGARIRMESAGCAIVDGVDHLSAAPVRASDLRACASLILCGLAARGCTRIAEAEHIDRGYNRIEEKLSRLGARIRRVESATGQGGGATACGGLRAD
jgi:UDP-N-acetylglucosamine 1-carboxyvinyltransferase